MKTRASQLERVLCPRGRAGIELLEAHFERHVYDRHMHDTYAIGITLRGVQRFWCRGATHDSTPGHVIVISPGEVHDGRSGSAGGYAYRMFYLHREMLAAALEDVLVQNREFVAARPLLADPDLAHRLDVAWNATANAPDSFAADELLHQSLGLLAVRCSGRARVVRTNRDEGVVRQVHDYLHAHFDQPVTMSDLSAIARVSRFQLTRLFQKTYGMPLHAYHLQLRLEEAKGRLACGQPIAAVASELNFVDQSHLHRRFKGTFGITPGQWRAAHGYKTLASSSGYRGNDDADAAAGRLDQTI